MAWHVEVDRDLCQGTGICASMAEHVFQFDGRKSRAVRDTVEPEDAITDAADDRKDHPENHPVDSRCHAASLRRWTATGCRAASAQCGIGDAKRNWSVDGCPTGQAGQHSSTLAVTDLSITAAPCGAPRPYGFCGTASGKAP